MRFWLCALFFCSAMIVAAGCSQSTPVTPKDKAGTEPEKKGPPAPPPLPKPGT